MKIMFYLVNSVNFIKYLNYFYKLNLPPLKHKLGEREGKKGIKKRGKGAFASTSSRNCKQSVIQIPLSPFWIKEIYKFNQAIFANFKIPLTRKSWLLKFGFAYSLAQILEPKLLIHEILKFI